MDPQTALDGMAAEFDSCEVDNLTQTVTETKSQAVFFDQ